MLAGQPLAVAPPSALPLADGADAGASFLSPPQSPPPQSPPPPQGAPPEDPSEGALGLLFGIFIILPRRTAPLSVRQR